MTSEQIQVLVWRLLAHMQMWLHYIETKDLEKAKIEAKAAVKTAHRIAVILEAAKEIIDLPDKSP